MADYTFDFSAFAQATAAPGPTRGMGVMSSGAPAAAPRAPAAAGGRPGGWGFWARGAPPAAAGAPAASGADSGSSDLSAMIAQSPFGALLNLPGVTAANLFSNVNPADYGGGNPFAALASTSGSGAAAPYGGNPFASIGTLVSNDYMAATQGSTASSTGGM